VAPINPPGGITVVDPGNAADHPRPVSLPSAPRVLLHLPPDPPAAPAPENVTLSRGDPDGAGAVEVTIEIVDPPRAHPKAVGPYRLAVWTQWQDGEIAPAAAANGAPLEGVWPDLADGTVSVTVPPSSPAGDPVRPIIVRMAIVDPAGRVGGMTTMSTP